MENIMNIGQYLDNFLEDIRSKSYNPQWQRAFTNECLLIRNFANDNGVNSYSLDFGEQYLRHKYPNDQGKPFRKDMPWVKNRSYRTITQLNDFYVFGTVTRGRQRRRFDGVPMPNQKLIAEFISYCQQKRSLSKYVADAHAGKAKQFLGYLDNKNISIEHITDEVIIEYALIIIQNYSSDGVSATYYSLRIFFGFLFVTHRSQLDYAKSIPIFKIPAKAQIPSVWLHEDIKKILNAVDRGSPLGKRDYAVLMLVTKLGIRDSDVRNLKFENIDWDNKRISIIQAKTSQPLSLPISNDVGWALIDYLKNGRPSCAEKYIFVTHTFPVKCFGPCSRFGWLVGKYANAAGLDISARKHGLHSLRHTLATRLLESNTPLPVISNILGHINSTEVDTYIKVNIEQLRKCALNPENLLNETD